MNNRVVVTGLGVVSPIGTGQEAYFDGLVAGRSGFKKITRFDASTYPCQIAAQIDDFDPTLYLDKKEARRMVRFIQFAVAASKLAVKDANLEINDSNTDEVGVMIGSGIGGLSILEEQANVLRDKGVSRISPFTVPYMISNMAAGIVSIELKAKGPNSCVVTACASGTHNIGDAFRILARGDAKVMIAGGTEASITPLGMAGFCAARALATSYNDNPEKASRPFDAKRDGFVMGEGSGIVVLETLENAEARGAKIYAELVGYGMSGDAYHITSPSPSGEGAAKAMMLAVKDAGLSLTDIDYINAHGTSTSLNDKYETMAIKRAFGDHAKKLAVSSNKSMIGHLLGAAGAVEFIATVLTIQKGIIPPTMNYEFPDPECDLDYVPNKAREANVRAAISNSLGFGGHNAVLAVKKFL